ncbi:MAG TPA: AbrB/MazE/SpoVT family DNA-binding domain-containing protein [Candidatus Korarchaeota archaeon]|nr:AbrB/MazE/SpoVT family DNA-binding domain-containing protein [Candidatus Korarchaeota archaeon]
MRKRIGPKGQILIPKPIRDALGLHPGVEVMIEVRGDEVIITKPKIEGSYTEYYISTRSPKLKKLVDLKKIILEEDELDPNMS